MSDPLTYWWGVTLCPPKLNEVALAESVVVTARTAAIREMTTNSEAQTPSVEPTLEFDGLRMECAIESTPHSNTQAYNCTYDGSELIQRFEEGDPEEVSSLRALAQEQLGVDIPLRSAGAYSTPTNPRPRERETETRDSLWRAKRGRCTGRDQGKETAGISMVIPPQQLLLQRQLKKVEERCTM